MDWYVFNAPVHQVRKSGRKRKLSKAIVDRDVSAAIAAAEKAYRKEKKHLAEVANASLEALNLAIE